MNFRASLELAVMLVALPVVLSQQLYPSLRVEIGSCPQLRSDSDIFGNRTAFSNRGLLPSLFISGDGTEPLTLRILRVHQLCEAIGAYRNTASSVAYLVEYEVPSDTTPRLAQVSLDCIADTFNPAANYSFYPLPDPGATQQSDFNTARNSLGTLVTDSSQIVSTFSTPTAYMCGECGPLGGIFADQATRCIFCLSSCTQGMRRCLGRGSDQCCAWFLDDRCVQFCPFPLAGNPDTFDCGCGILSLQNGTLTYSNNDSLGSIATLNCDVGYRLTAESPSTRTCTLNGWSNNSTATCANIDECSTDQHNCHENATCTDTTGNFTCQCNAGYEGDGVTCVDIDECTTSRHNCHADATCQNTAGAFTCQCNAGYEGDGVSCNNIDECSTDQHNCHENATCMDTTGSFTCQCNAGYVGDGVTCVDVDECSTSSHNCHADATCQNTAGAFTCQCNAGYEGDGVSCNNIDECSTDQNDCHENATCTDTTGSFTCQCNSGYVGDGVTCVDVDECTTSSHNCHADATCQNTAGSFTCQCNAGYEGDGVTCSNIDECSTDQHNCHANAMCTDTTGSFTCLCDSGYEGDGVVCIYGGCPSLSLTGGTVTYSHDFRIGSVATFICNETGGYILTPGSPAKRTCSFDGWTSMNASCSLFDCKMDDLQEPENGGFILETRSTTFGSVATYTCNERYQLTGVAERTCGLNGWSHENPTCVFDCMMTDLQKPENGEYTLDSGTTTFGSVVTFKCSDTYKLNGAATRTCGLNGWSGANPTCDKDEGLSSDDLGSGLPTQTVALIIVVVLLAVIVTTVIVGSTMAAVAVIKRSTVKGKAGKSPDKLPMAELNNNI